jgi:hypothetical protein
MGPILDVRIKKAIIWTFFLLLGVAIFLLLEKITQFLALN